MHLEFEKEQKVENTNSEIVYYNHFGDGEVKKYLVPAVVESVDDSGKLLLTLLDEDDWQKRDKFMVDPTSVNLHPCGYWNYLSSSSSSSNSVEFKCSNELKKFLNQAKFEWKLLLKDKITNNKTMMTNSIYSAAPFEIFMNEQKDDMKKATFYPEFEPVENYLSCDYPLNPRFVWSTLDQFSPDDISFVYEAIGLIRNRVNLSSERVSMSTSRLSPTNENEAKEASLSNSCALVLLPNKIDSLFVRFPSVNFVDFLINLNIACVHREYIELLIGSNNYLYINYPHLVHSSSFNLIQNKFKLELRHLLNIMFTCLDLSYSPVRIYLYLCFLCVKYCLHLHSINLP